MSYRYCTYCDKDHPISLCPSTYGGGSARANLRCSYCGSNKHSATYCLKTAGGAAARRANPSGEFLD